jgi:multidrug efflux pump subunit AcrB
LADVNVARSFSEINRIEQLRSISITADLDETTGNAYNVIQDLRATFMPGLLERYPTVRVLWQGQAERTTESVDSLVFGLMIALAAMFVLLTIEFRSYLQPLLIMAIIPFGVIGAIWGHFLQGMEMTMFSLFGIVALTGVVVNDSIVLIDFINRHIASGLPLKEALVDSGVRRLRPVLLTSATTIVGLLPILLERSFQAQIVIPMATSLCFGLLMATLLVLFLIPTMYYVYAKLSGGGAHSPDADIHGVPDESLTSASLVDDATTAGPASAVPTSSAAGGNGGGPSSSHGRAKDHRVGSSTGE